MPKPNSSEVDEPVAVVPYDAEWLDAFRREKSVLLGVLGRDAVAIEHFGSTAVPGLAAKPVVDILVGLRQYPPAGRVLREVARLGYECLGEAGVAGRYYCRKRDGRNAVNVSLVLHGESVWSDNLCIRDYLRANPAEADRYAAHKRTTAEAAPTLLGYSQRKAGFMAALAKRARTWKERPSDAQES